MKKIKVLFVTSYRKGKGISPFVKTQADSISKKGIDLDWFSIKGSGILNYLKSIFMLRKLLKRKKIDIIHAHFGFCGIVSKLAATDEKIIVSFLGDDLIGSISKKHRYTRVSKIYTVLNQFFANFIYDYNIVKSKSLEKKLKKKKNLSIIPNGVNFSIFKTMIKEDARIFLGLPFKKKIIFFVGNPEGQVKNFKLALVAFEIIKKDFNVIMIPCKDIPFEKMPYYYNVADVALMTSFHEGSPNVIKEAMTCNCPIVSTNVGDVEEITKNTKGCYITSFDPRDVAEKIELALKFGRRTNGRKRILELGLEIDTIAPKIINIYKKILK